MPPNADKPGAGTPPNYADFKFKPVIDWVEVRVKLAGNTQPQHVRERIEQALPRWGKPPYVNAETDAPSRSSNTVSFRIQNPPSPTVLMCELQAVARPGDPPLTEHDIEVIGIEVALDAYHRTDDREALIDLTHHLYWHHAWRPKQDDGTRPRITAPGHYRAAIDQRDCREAIAAGWTINAGMACEKAPNGLITRAPADYLARYYFKTTDTVGQAPYGLLRNDQHRARIEVTLRGAALPFSTLAGWRCYPFQKLAPYFAMLLEKQSASTSAISTVLRARAGPLGFPLDPVIATEFRRSTVGDCIELTHRDHAILTHC